MRLAVDVYLPSGPAGVRAGGVPTITIFTPYYRRFALRGDAPSLSEPSVSAGRYRDFFVPRGYALVVVDVRGTGASFGVREGVRSPKERDDYREIVDWIVEQPWSNGAVGAPGISYVGAAADFLASTGHPVVKAIAPLFSVCDTCSDHYYPGGILLNRLAETCDELMIALDHGRGELLGKFAYYKAGEPLAADHELSGHPCVTMHLSASEADAALHVYLEDLAPDGTCRYVTEGMLRALHRKECAAPKQHQVVGPYRSYTRADASPLAPGDVATLRFSLLPTSWRAAAGHRLRVAIAGADADNFGQVPHGRPPVLSIRRGGVHASSIVLPLRPFNRRTLS